LGRLDPVIDAGSSDREGPRRLKLQRQGTRFTEFSSRDGSNWSKIGEADVPGADDSLDIGVFAHRSSARFLDFKVVQ
jgi:hypothetical protein